MKNNMKLIMENWRKTQKLLNETGFGLFDKGTMSMKPSQMTEEGTTGRNLAMEVLDLYTNVTNDPDDIVDAYKTLTYPEDRDAFMAVIDKEVEDWGTESAIGLTNLLSRAEEELQSAEYGEAEEY